MAKSYCLDRSLRLPFRLRCAAVYGLIFPFLHTPQTSATKLICSFKAWINPVSWRSADLKAVCPSGFTFFLFFLFIISLPPLLCPRRLAGSTQCYLLGGKGWGRVWRPQICPYLFWAHLKQIRPGCRCLFGSRALIKGLNPSYFPQVPISYHFGPCLLSQLQRFLGSHATFSSHPFHVVISTLHKEQRETQKIPLLEDAVFLHVLTLAFDMFIERRNLFN